MLQSHPESHWALVFWSGWRTLWLWIGCSPLITAVRLSLSTRSRSGITRLMSGSSMAAALPRTSDLIALVLTLSHLYLTQSQDWNKTISTCSESMLKMPLGAVNQLRHRRWLHPRNLKVSVGVRGQKNVISMSGYSLSSLHAIELRYGAIDLAIGIFGRR